MRPCAWPLAFKDLFSSISCAKAALVPWACFMLASALALAEVSFACSASTSARSLLASPAPPLPSTAPGSVEAEPAPLVPPVVAPLLPAAAPPAAPPVAPGLLGLVPTVAAEAEADVGVVAESLVAVWARRTGGGWWRGEEGRQRKS